MSRSDDGRMTRATWTANFIMARQRSLTSSITKFGWRNSGLNPFNPAKLVPRAGTPPPTFEQPTPSRAPLQSITAQNMEYIRTHYPPIDPPTKNCLLSLSSSLESLNGRIAVAEEENRELRDFLKAKRRPRAGVTVGHLGQHHLTDENVHRQVAAAN